MTTRPARARCLLPALVLPVLAALGLSACSCPTCNGHGYMKAEACSAQSPLLNPALKPADCITSCWKCDATGMRWGIGWRKDKADVRAEELEVLRVY